MNRLKAVVQIQITRVSVSVVDRGVGENIEHISLSNFTPYSAELDSV